jgi:hypothetical protein
VPPKLALDALRVHHDAASHAMNFAELVEKEIA